VEHFLKGAVTKKRAALDEEGSKGKKAKAQKKTGRGKTKELVDPTRPKGPKGAYMCFVSARRSQIKDANPDMTFPDIARELGVEWKTMSEASRHRYEQMAELDKDRYTREMLSYVPLSDEKMQELREQQSRRKAAGGLQVMYHCSPELTAFLGGVKTINRKELTTRIWKYFREHNLMDPINKRFIVPDTKLSKLLKLQDGERFLAFTVSRYLNPHLVKKVESQ
jgi:chromatin remodeling complex protein RSC6